MPTRNPVKQFFITFPQSGDMSKEHFTKLFPSCTYASCAQETHQDGNKHLHLIANLEKKISKSNLLKHIKNILPNDYNRIHANPIRSMKHTLEYIKKEDTTLYTIGELKGKKPKEVKNVESIRAEFVNELTSNWWTQELVSRKLK